jgi:hypothetical protein
MIEKSKVQRLGLVRYSISSGIDIEAILILVVAAMSCLLQSSLPPPCEQKQTGEVAVPDLVQCSQPSPK